MIENHSILCHCSECMLRQPPVPNIRYEYWATSEGLHIVRISTSSTEFAGVLWI